MERTTLYINAFVWLEIVLKQPWKNKNLQHSHFHNDLTHPGVKTHGIQGCVISLNKENNLRPVFDILN